MEKLIGPQEIRRVAGLVHVVQVGLLEGFGEQNAIRPETLSEILQEPQIKKVAAHEEVETPAWTG